MSPFLCQKGIVDSFSSLLHGSIILHRRSTAGVVFLMLVVQILACGCFPVATTSPTRSTTAYLHSERHAGSCTWQGRRSRRSNNRVHVVYDLPADAPILRKSYHPLRLARDQEELSFLDDLFWDQEITVVDGVQDVHTNTSDGSVLSLGIHHHHDEDADADDNADAVKKQNASLGVMMPSSSDIETPNAIFVPDLSSLSAASLLENIRLAPASEIAYFYLHKTLGLSEDTMWKITLEAGSVLGLTVLNLKKKVRVLRDAMQLSEEDVRSIISLQPTILHMSADNNLVPTMTFLTKALKLDASGAELRKIILQYPCVLCYSIANLKSKLRFFLSSMSLTTEQARSLILATPQLLTLSVDTSLQPKLRFLRREMMLTLPDLRTIVRKNPKILLYNLDHNLRGKIIFYFVMRLHMEVPKHVRKILVSFPEILDYNLERHILPLTVYFTASDSLDYSALEFRNILLKYPRLMTHSLVKIKSVVGYLRYELGLDPTQVKRVLFQAPQVVSLDLDRNLKQKIVYFRREFGLTDEDELRKVVSGMPTLLLCSVTANLQPKGEYLVRQFGHDRDAVRDAIVAQPSLLGYSLENRIMPRMERVKAVGEPPRKITTVITLSPDKFEAWVDARQEHSRSKQANDVVTVSTDKAQREKEEIIRRQARIVNWSRRPGELPAGID